MPLLTWENSLKRLKGLTESSYSHGHIYFKKRMQIRAKGRDHWTESRSGPNELQASTPLGAMDRVTSSQPDICLCVEIANQRSSPRFKVVIGVSLLSCD